MSTITITTFNYPNWQRGGASATLRIYADVQFRASSGTIIERGGLGNWYKVVTCTITGTTLTVPQFTIDSTTDSSDPNATYTGVFYDSNGRRRESLFGAYRIPHNYGSSVAWSAIFDYNAMVRSILPYAYPNIDQVQHLLDTEIDALTKADVGLGNVDNTSDVNKPVSTAQAAADAVVLAAAIQRSNHTGTQTASTISDFNAAALLAAPAETATTAGALINAAGAATPNNGDFVATAEVGGLLKKISWTNIKAFLKTYFDTLYAPLSGSGYSTLLTTYADLAAAITAIGATPTELVIDKNTTVTTNVVVPATCKLKFVKGFKITVTNPGTINFQGQGVVQEDLDGTTQLFDVPQPLVYNGNITGVRGSTTITQNGNNYDMIQARDAGRFLYLPDVNLRTTVSSVTNTNNLVMATPVPSADFAVTELSGSFTALATDDKFTSTSHGLMGGQRVRVSGGSLPTGVVAGTTYYVIVSGKDIFKLASTYLNAMASTAINLTADGSGTVTATNIDSFTAANAGDLFTTANHRLRSGQVVQLSGGSLPTGVVAATNYFVIPISTDTYQLAASYADAVAETEIVLSSDGSGTYTASASILPDGQDQALSNNRGFFYKRDHGMPTGYLVRLTTTGTLPNGYAAATDYWVIRHGPHTFRLASTERNAYSNTAMTLTDTGIGVHTVDATLSGSNDLTGAFAYIYNIAWTGTTYPKSISTKVFDTSDMGSIAYAGVAAPYIDAGLSGDINAAGLALAEKPSQINIYPRDEGFVFYGAAFPKHVYEFQEGTFPNSSINPSLIYFSDVVLKGKGKFSTILEEPNVQGQYIIFISANDAGVTNRRDRIENVEIYGFQFKGVPRPQVYRTGAAESNPTVTGKKVKNINVHDNYLNYTASLGIFFGEGIRLNTTEHYSEDIRIVDNWFYGIASQAVGVTAGSSVEVSRNRIHIESAYDAAAISAIDIEPIGSLSHESAISAIRVNDNVIDARASKAGPVNGINIVSGEYQGFRAVEVAGNFIIGLTPEAVSSGSPIQSSLQNGIIINQTMGGAITNNKIFGSSELRAIWITQSGYLTVKDNVIHAAGYNNVIQVDGSSNCYFADNIAYDGPIAGTAASIILEQTQTVTVDTNGTAVTFDGSPDISYFTASMVNGVIRISAVDYEVASVQSNTALTLKSTAGVQNNIVSTIRPVRNKYKDNTITTHTTVDTGAFSSVVNSRFQDFRLSGNVTIDPASVNADTVSSQNFTLTGAKTGDNVILNPPTAGLTAGLLVQQAYISATDTLTVVFFNQTAAPIDQASGSWRYTLLR